ncbi:MAG: 2-oxo-4-hydroxy-4-carboxy-5-ureidoimidazoline decarboxylase, partial [Phyllobacterium sp.]|uniref:2-oxo-4-hydroxy-4-carboxy-5-ureidoimidazoline decarboxylase n=1 Tax=Phyllobacterium sp. TaxID=1871046 RepID=UPI0030F2362B
QHQEARPSLLDEAAFVDRFGGVFEHSPWIARRVFASELSPAHDSATGLHAALSAAFRMASEEERLGVLNAHPDLAGKLAQAKRLTESSTQEQASAGLDALTDDERSEFTALNTNYIKRFGFPFIIAVRGLDKQAILKAFTARLENDRQTEFTSACHEVEKIALLRLRDMLPD